MFFDARWLPHLQPMAAIVAAGGGVHQHRAAKRQEELLDKALEETFPASDPVSVAWIA